MKDFQEFDDNPQDVNQSFVDFYGDSDQGSVNNNNEINERIENEITEFLINDEPS